MSHPRSSSAEIGQKARGLGCDLSHLRASADLIDCGLPLKTSLKVVAAFVMLVFFASPALAAVRCLWMPPTHACCGSMNEPAIAPGTRSCCQVSAPGITPAAAPVTQTVDRDVERSVGQVPVVKASRQEPADPGSERLRSKPCLERLCTLLI
jgi:hypothetical protein